MYFIQSALFITNFNVTNYLIQRISSVVHSLSCEKKFVKLNLLFKCCTTYNEENI